MIKLKLVKPRVVRTKVVGFAEATFVYDRQSGEYKLKESSSQDGGSKETMIQIGQSAASTILGVLNAPGGQIANPENMPEINIRQFGDKLYVNGRSRDRKNKRYTRSIRNPQLQKAA